MLIRLITINDMHNYGNRLQNYATQQFLRNNSYNVENIVDATYYPLVIRGIYKKLRYFASVTLHKGLKYYILSQKFEKNFLKFNRNIFYSGIEVKTSDELNQIDLSGDVVIIGSDQVWNPQIAMSDITLLNGVRCKKKISFASSFGVDAIQGNMKIVDSLKDFQTLSVREEAGANIIYNLTGRKAEVLSDPTMLLSADDWRRVAKKPKNVQSGYVLTYFLSAPCKKAREQIELLRDGKKVYELLNLYDRVAGTAGPAEFLWLFDHADLVLTDSFHACVFSFLFNKPFVVYDRNWTEENMNSRLETLLGKFHLERKYANSGLENDIWEHNYEDGYKQLELERQKATDFLKKALDC